MDWTAQAVAARSTKRRAEGRSFSFCKQAKEHPLRNPKSFWISRIGVIFSLLVFTGIFILSYLVILCDFHWWRFASGTNSSCWPVAWVAGRKLHSRQKDSSCWWFNDVEAYRSVEENIIRKYFVLHNCTVAFEIIHGQCLCTIWFLHHWSSLRTELARPF